jgi:hypothetical protein
MSLPLDRVGVAFFYCDGGLLEKQGAFNIFSTLLKQLAIQSAENAGLSQLKAVLNRYRRRFVPSTEFVVSELEWIFHCFSDVYLIVDGLDECPKRELINPILLRLGRKARVLVTSRPEIDMVSAFDGQPYLNIDDAILGDIKTHVQWQMENNERLCHIRPSLKRKIEDELLARSAGM